VSDGGVRLRRRRLDRARRIWFRNDTACGSSIDLPAFLVCLRDRSTGASGLASAEAQDGDLFDNVGSAAAPHLVRRRSST
jgi:hypothetical protein